MKLPTFGQQSGTTGTATAGKVKLPVFGSPAPTPVSGSSSSATISDIMTKIAKNESQGNGGYSAVGPSTSTGAKALGKYQIMETNLPQWSKEAIGRTVSKQEFLSSPVLQERIARYQITKIHNQYGTPEDTLAVWFSGSPAKGNNKKDVLGTSTQDYISKAGYGSAPPPKDISGRPFLTVDQTIPKTFMSPETSVTSIDKSRVAIPFDPTKAQKLDRKILTNGRMPESISSKIKADLGGTYNTELDHKIALALAGSNDKTNLQIEKGIPGQGSRTATDSLETSLANDVVSGKISLIDAQVQLSKAKGLPVPMNKDSFKNTPVNDFLLNHPNTLIPLGAAQDTLTNIPKMVGGYLKSLFTHPMDTINSSSDAMFNAVGGNAVVHPIQTFKSIVDMAGKQDDTTIQNLVDSTVKFRANVIDGGNRTASEKVGTTLDLLHSLASTILLPVSQTFSIAEQLPILKPAAKAVGVIFDKTGKITSFSANALLDTIPSKYLSPTAKEQLRAPIERVSTLMGQIVLGGYIYGKLTGVPEEIRKGQAIDDQLKTIIEDAKAKQRLLNQKELKDAIDSGDVQKINQALTNAAKGETGINFTETPAAPADVSGGKTSLPVFKESAPVEKTTDSKGNVVERNSSGEVTRISDKTGNVKYENANNSEVAKVDSAGNADVQAKGILEKQMGKETASKFDKYEFKQETVKVEDTRSYKNEASVSSPKIRAWERKIQRGERPPIIEILDSNGTRTTVDGTTKFQAYKNLGFKEVPTLVGRERVAGETGATKVESTVPAEQGKSKVGQSIEAKAVEDKLTKGFDQTAGYDKMTIKDQSNRATDLVNNSIDEARAVVRGEAPLPDGLRGEALITAMEERIKAETDSAKAAEMLYELANSPHTSATSYGAQGMRLLAERTKDSAAAKLMEIKKAREAKAAKGKTVETRKTYDDLKKEIQKDNLTKEQKSWDKFLEEIKC